MGPVRLVALVAASLSAALYTLIGFQVLPIRALGAEPEVDVLGFGLSAAAAFLLVAAVVASVRRRWAWILAAAFTAAVILAYVAMADVREPAVEVWGLSITAVQAVLLTALVWRAARGPRSRERGETPSPQTSVGPA